MYSSDWAVNDAPSSCQTFCAVSQTANDTDQVCWQFALI
jgi:hypothetical protein